jgi:hypothetical protein
MFFDVKNILGAGEAHNHTTNAVERTVPSELFCHSIPVVWYTLRFGAEKGGGQAVGFAFRGTSGRMNPIAGP